MALITGLKVGSGKEGKVGIIQGRGQGHDGFAGGQFPLPLFLGIRIVVPVQCGMPGVRDWFPFWDGVVKFGCVKGIFGRV